MKVMAEQGDWAIVLSNSGNYYIRHLTCGSYLRQIAHIGCTCGVIDKPIGQRKAKPVDPNILKRFQLIVKDIYSHDT